MKRAQPVSVPEEDQARIRAWVARQLPLAPPALQRKAELVALDAFVMGKVSADHDDHCQALRCAPEVAAALARELFAQFRRERAVSGWLAAAVTRTVQT